MLQVKSVQKIVRFSFNNITESCEERRVQPNLYSLIYAHYFFNLKKKAQCILEFIVCFVL